MARQRAEAILQAIVRAHGVREVSRKLNWVPSKISRWTNGGNLHFKDVEMIAKAVGCRLELRVPDQGANDQESAQ